MQPDPGFFLENAGITIPLVGFYDLPNIEGIEDYLEPKQGARACFYAFFRQWEKGKYLHLTEDNPGCRGACAWLFENRGMSRNEYIEFLCDDEGLKANYELMGKWLDSARAYKRENEHILIGPLKPELYDYCKSITFFVNADQLSLMIIAAQYFHTPGDPDPVRVPFGAGCQQIVAEFGDLNKPEAIIGGTDTASRQYMDKDVLAFTVTKPMFEMICKIDENSFLTKPFWIRLMKSRKKGK